MDGEIVVVVLIVLALLAALITWSVKVSRRLRDNLEHAAKGRGGRRVRSFWKGSGIDFDADGVPAQLRFFMGTDKAPPWTRLRFNWAPPGRLRAAPEGFLARLRKLFGAEDLRVGDEAFDKAFLIQGSPSSWVRNVLGRETRARLTRLSGLGASWTRGQGMRMDLGPAGITLFCHRNLVWEREHLESFIEEGVAFLRHVRSLGKAEAGVLTAREAAARGRCPVCGHDLETTLRRCRGCATLHQEECWAYFAGCAIYGCAMAGRADRGEDLKAKAGPWLARSRQAPPS